MAPQRTAVITGSASRDAAIGLQSPSTSTVGTSPLARLARAEKSLVCNELRCLSKDRPLPCALFTGSPPSATINHNDLDTWNKLALILAPLRGGLGPGSC